MLLFVLAGNSSPVEPLWIRLYGSVPIRGGENVTVEVGLYSRAANYADCTLFIKRGSFRQGFPVSLPPGESSENFTVFFPGGKNRVSAYVKC